MRSRLMVPFRVFATAALRSTLGVRHSCVCLGNQQFAAMNASTSGRRSERTPGVPINYATCFVSVRSVFLTFAKRVSRVRPGYAANCGFPPARKRTTLCVSEMAAYSAYPGRTLDSRSFRRWAAPNVALGAGFLPAPARGCGRHGATFLQTAPPQGPR